MAATFTMAGKRSGSVPALAAIIGATVITAGYWGASWLPSRGQPAERAFAPVSQPWHAKEESHATNKDRVARYKYIYADQKTGQLKEAPSAVSTEVHPVQNIPANLHKVFPADRYDGDA